jgi:hypothetical protein
MNARTEPELTKAQEDEFAMELAKADFLKRVGEASRDAISPHILSALEIAFTTGFKMGVAWRDEP